MEKKRTHVVAAIVKDGDKYLCMQRCRSKYEYISEHWEFPGGKVERGENDYEALLREIKEELDWDIFIGRKIATVEYEYPDFIVSLTAYLCKGDDKEFKLLEHLDYKWLCRDELKSLKWTDADRLLIPYI